MNPLESVELAPLTTLRVGGRARWFLDAENETSVTEALAWATRRGVPLRILGGGSNVVATDDDFEGLVLRVAIRGLTFHERGGDVLAVGRAGEPWDELVSGSVARDLQGLECLSGIPGWTGATPIQNVGAYGQEVAETLRTVRVVDRKSLEIHALAAEECRFAYRDSRFKSEEPERFVVLSVEFSLKKRAAPSIRYAELARYLDATGVEQASLADVRRAVLALRAKKSMLLDPNDENCRSCGSFFTNPVVPEELAERVEHAAGALDMPRYPQPDGRVKLAAGWLIERAGFAKGYRFGPVGLSTKHALSIVCHAGARSRDVLALAREIQSGVRERFGVELVPEPVIWKS